MSGLEYHTIVKACGWGFGVKAFKLIQASHLIGCHIKNFHFYSLRCLLLGAGEGAEVIKGNINKSIRAYEASFTQPAVITQTAFQGAINGNLRSHFNGIFRCAYGSVAPVKSV
ncbi:hypothetical protein VRRI112168_08295 [Vreelandella rituensis]